MNVTGSDGMENSDSFQASKRHKKHKHKKHKKKRTSEDSELEGMVAQEEKIASKVKILMPNKNANSSNKKKKSGKGRDSATSSEEERWLDAIESGKLEDVDDELRKIKPKDPALMTARQRAMYERGTEGGPPPSTGPLLALPSGYKEKVMTAEAIQKAAIKSQKRKQLADEKREKDKKKTMERLLKKQESKSTKSAKSKPNKSNVPVVTYRMNNTSISLSFPNGYDYPLQAQKVKPAAKSRICSVPGCGNLRRYECSQTGAALCSFQCYKRNISSCIL